MDAQHLQHLVDIYGRIEAQYTTGITASVEQYRGLSPECRYTVRLEYTDGRVTTEIDRGTWEGVDRTLPYFATLGWIAPQQKQRETAIQEQALQYPGFVTAKIPGYELTIQKITRQYSPHEWTITITRGSGGDIIHGSLDFFSWQDLVTFSRDGGLFGQEITQFTWE